MLAGAMSTGFHHEAVFYAGDDEYAAGTLPELRATLDDGGSALVAVGGDKARLLSSALGADAERVRFADMERLGRNPACIISAWREFVAEAADDRVLGIGEPVWSALGAAELVEFRRHESLLNLAFDGGREWRLLCPYDVERLAPGVIEDARHNHRHVSENGVSNPSTEYVETDAFLAADDELPAPRTPADELVFGGHDLTVVRAFVAERATRAGLGLERRSDLVLAVHELASNTLRHSGTEGVLRVWRENDTLLCEVSDEGRIDDPLIGRERAPDLEGAGRGLWLVNHLCDLVQLRSSEYGNVVRLHMRLQ